MRHWRAFLLTLLVAGPVLAAGLQFPALTGRVVDDAHILSANAVQQLESISATLEAQTTDQLVVVTVPSLQGATIEDYGYQLGRHWAIGQKGKDNGVLLIVAPKERKVRIEVGYGLEGTLTDALSSQIIQGSILPQFRNGNMENGIFLGVNGITRVLKGEVVAPQPHASAHHESGDSGGAIIFIALLVLFLFSQVVLFVLYVVFWIIGSIFSLFGFNGLLAFARRMRDRITPADKALIAWLMMPSGRITGSGGGSFRGFSGGGGSFGGGGSSGSW